MSNLNKIIRVNLWQAYEDIYPWQDGPSLGVYDVKCEDNTIVLYWNHLTYLMAHFDFCYEVIMKLLEENKEHNIEHRLIDSPHEYFRTGITGGKNG